jgi:hypothetical protein
MRLEGDGIGAREQAARDVVHTPDRPCGNGDRLALRPDRRLR